MNNTKLLSLCAALLLSACSTLGTSNSEQTEATTDTAQSEQDPKYRDFDQDKDTLYDLMVAEIAAQRNQFTVTLLNYLQQAHITRDIEIIKRAINAAQFLKDIEATTEMALLWLDVDPKAIPAHQLLAFQYSLQQDYAQAMSHIDKIIELNGEARVDSLAVTASTLPEKDREVLLSLYEELHEKYPDNHELTYSLALVQKSLKQYDAALETLKPVLKIAPDFEAPTVLKTNLLYDKGLLKDAISYAEDKYDDFPNNHNLGRLYATMLIEDKRLDDAEVVFKSLIENYPQAPRLKLSLAIVYLENRKLDEARDLLNVLIEERKLTHSAYFYLARIADIEGNVELAIENYQNVGPGPHSETSFERAIYLMVTNEQVDRALETLAKQRKDFPGDALKLWMLQVKVFSSVDDMENMNKSIDLALEEFPSDEQLLYARAMNREADGDLAGMEADLRKIIDNNADHAIALNALGYTLADQTDRTLEAFELIQRAISLKPDNPAILDSMGWVLYRMGKNKEALVFLLKAFQQFQDGEIAAHLGEVLMSLGQVTEAHEVWAALFLKQPNHKVLNETVERMDPSFYEQVKKSLESGQPAKAVSANESADNQDSSSSGATEAATTPDNNSTTPDSNTTSSEQDAKSQ